MQLAMPAYTGQNALTGRLLAGQSGAGAAQAAQGPGQGQPGLQTMLNALTGSGTSSTQRLLGRRVRRRGPVASAGGRTTRPQKPAGGGAPKPRGRARSPGRRCRWRASEAAGRGHEVTRASRATCRARCRTGSQRHQGEVAAGRVPVAERPEAAEEEARVRSARAGVANWKPPINPNIPGMGLLEPPKMPSLPAAPPVSFGGGGPSFTTPTGGAGGGFGGGRARPRRRFPTTGRATRLRRRRRPSTRTARGAASTTTRRARPTPSARAALDRERPPSSTRADGDDRHRTQALPACAGQRPDRRDRLCVTRRRCCSRRARASCGTCRCRNRARGNRFRAGRRAAPRRSARGACRAARRIYLATVTFTLAQLQRQRLQADRRRRVGRGRAHRALTSPTEHFFVYDRNLVALFDGLRAAQEVERRHDVDDRWASRRPLPRPASRWSQAARSSCEQLRGRATATATRGLSSRATGRAVATITPTAGNLTIRVTIAASTDPQVTTNHDLRAQRRRRASRCCGARGSVANATTHVRHHRAGPVLPRRPRDADRPRRAGRVSASASCGATAGGASMRRSRTGSTSREVFHAAVVAGALLHRHPVRARRPDHGARRARRHADRLRQHRGLPHHRADLARLRGAPQRRRGRRVRSGSRAVDRDRSRACCTAATAASTSSTARPTRCSATTSGPAGGT